MHQDCVFCKIISGQLPATVIAQNEDIIVIKDINPCAPIHYLIIPKKHVVAISDLTEQDTQLAGALLMMAQQLSQQDPAAREFRLVSNNGAAAGQVVFHIHIHFIAGRPLKLVTF